MREFVYLPVIHTLSAGATVNVEVLATHLYVKAISVQTGLQVSIDGSKFNNIYEGTHFNFTDTTIKSVKFFNNTSSSITFTALMCSEQITDSSFVLTGSLSVKSVANTIVTPAQLSVSTKTSIAADTSRREITIQNNGTDSVWIGDTNVAINRGFQLKAGKSTILATTAEIFLIANSGTQAINTLTMKDV